ncbi:MAG TPA: DinB family protein [Thermodesulfobacteriota bacterium]|nr:DinB family protein [Thermodesulfobacteriota bacterium]
MNADKVIREQLLALLKAGNAHMSFRDAVSGFPLKEINRRLPNASYTVWHLLEHIRIAQWDILEFVRNPHHISPEFPAGYWPKEDEMATATQWKKTIREFLIDLKAVEKLVKDPRTDFFNPIPHAKDYNLFLEVLTLADHNAYHVGEFVTLRRVLNMKPIKEY